MVRFFCCLVNNSTLKWISENKMAVTISATILKLSKNKLHRSEVLQQNSRVSYRVLGLYIQPWLQEVLPQH